MKQLKQYLKATPADLRTKKLLEKANGELHEVTKALSSFTAEKNAPEEISKKALLCILKLTETFVSAYDSPILQTQIAEIYAYTQLFHSFQNLMMTLNKNFTYYPASGHVKDCYCAIGRLCVEASHCSEKFAKQCMESGIVKVMVGDLKALQTRFKGNVNAFAEYVLRAMNILYNCVTTEDNESFVKYLKESGVMVPVRLYADNSHLVQIANATHLPVISIILLTYLSSNEYIFEAKPDVISFLMQHLLQALTARNKETRDGFRINELLTGITRLCENEKNNAAFGNTDLLQALTALLTEGSADLYIPSATLIWKLASAKENEKIFSKQSFAVKALQELSKQTTNSQLQKMIDKALFAIKAHSNSDQVRSPLSTQNMNEIRTDDRTEKPKRAVTVSENLKKQFSLLKKALQGIKPRGSPTKEVIHLLSVIERDVLATKRHQKFSNSYVDQFAYIGGVQLLQNYLEVLTKEGQQQPQKGLALDCYKKVRSLCWNATNTSLYFCDECRKCGMLSFLIEDLRKLKDLFSSDPNGLGFRVLEALSIIQNCAKSSSNIGYLQKHNIIELIQSYRERTRSVSIRGTTFVPIVCDIILAYVTDEEQSDVIITSDTVNQYIIGNLCVATSKEDRAFEGFSVIELLAALQKLARNNKNGVKILTELKLIDETMVEELLNIGTDDEKKTTLELLCQLAFVNENKQVICDLKPVLQQLRLLTSNCSDREVENLARLTLFVLNDGKREAVLHDSQNNSSGLKNLKQMKSVEKNEKLVVICYQEDDHDVVMKIKTGLEEAGYEVWLDVDKTGVSLLETQDIYNIEQATAIIICMSRKYKDSLHCRAVAEYVYRCGANDFIPLLMEESYSPSGWLDLIEDEVEESYINAYDGYSSELHEKLIQRLNGNLSIYQCTHGESFDTLNQQNTPQKAARATKLDRRSERDLSMTGLVRNNTLREKISAAMQTSEATTFLHDRKGSGLSSRTFTKKHVMISYQHNQKVLIRQVKNRLARSGYDVWIDEENMGSNLIDSMVGGVDNAAVILLCMSKSYENSYNCRDEAEYARKVLKRDAIIPLLVEPSYKPTGWLDFLIGQRFYHDITDGYTDIAHEKLVKQIGDRGKKPR